MNLHLYTPEMESTVRSLMEVGYEQLAAQTSQIFPDHSRPEELVRLPVCHIASRIMTGLLLGAGIAAFREEHPQHFITTLMANESSEPTEDDPIVCLTWLQWTVDSSNVTDGYRRIQQFGQLEAPGFFGPRKDIRARVPEGIYRNEYSTQYIQSRAGAFDLIPIQGRINPQVYTWNPHADAFESVSRQ